MSKPKKYILNRPHDGNTRAQTHGVNKSDRAMIADKRSRIARCVFQYRDSLTESLGSEESLSEQQKILIDRASFKVTRCILAEAEIMRTNGEVSESLKTEYLKWSHSLREDLRLLGLERKARQLPSLKDYVKQTYGSTEQKSNGNVSKSEAFPQSLASAPPESKTDEKILRDESEIVIEVEKK